MATFAPGPICDGSALPRRARRRMLSSELRRARDHAARARVEPPPSPPLVDVSPCPPAPPAPPATNVASLTTECITVLYHYAPRLALVNTMRPWGCATLQSPGLNAGSVSSGAAVCVRRALNSHPDCTPATLLHLYPGHTATDGPVHQQQPSRARRLEAAPASSAEESQEEETHPARRTACSRFACAGASRVRCVLCGWMHRGGYL